VDPGQLRFEVTKPKISWGTYVRDLMRPKFGGGFEDYSIRPSVVVENYAGEKRVIAVTKRRHEAEEKAVVIEEDFKALGPAAWCERYEVPPSFVTG
jgi:hypothetical protein